MSKNDSRLNDIRIASPCRADWNEMYGDDRKRFCGDCKLNVYNLSGMTQDEAEYLVANAEGRLCVRFYRRADGTVLTKDCPVGWARVKRRLSSVATAAASLMMAIITGVFFVSLFSRGDHGSETGVVVGKMTEVNDLPNTGQMMMPNPAIQGNFMPTREMKGEVDFVVPQNRPQKRIKRLTP